MLCKNETALQKTRAISLCALSKSKAVCMIVLHILLGEVVLAVLVFPLAFGGDGLHHVPMLCNLAVLDAEEVVIGGGLSGKGTFTDGSSLVAFCCRRKLVSNGYLSIFIFRRRFSARKAAIASGEKLPTLMVMS